MIWRKVLCSVTLLYAVIASSAEVHYLAGTTLMHATNINRQNTATESEVAQTLRGSVSVIENTATLVMNVDASLQATHYANNQLADATTGQMLGNALWSIRPGQLEWYASNIYTQMAIDPLSSNTPGNRQNVNALSTGPNYTMRFNSRSQLELEARAENYAFENADTDNNRALAAARLNYRFTASISSNLNYESTKVMFENTVLNSDFARNDMFLSLHYQRNTNTAEAQGGYTIISNDNTADARASRYLLALENRRTRTTTLRAEYSRNVSDTSSNLRSITTADSTNPTLLATSAQLFIRTTARLNSTSTLSSGTLILSAHKTESDYLTDDTLDQIENGASILNSWNLNGRSTFSIDGRYIETDYTGQPVLRIDEDYIYGATYIYRYGRNININLRGEYLERESTTLLQNYEDRRIIFTLEYVSR